MSRRHFAGLLGASGAVSASVPHAPREAEGAKPHWELVSHFWDRFDLEIIRSLGLGKQDRVLDAGCGYGGHLLLLARFAGSVAGFDRDPARVDIAKGRLASAGLGRNVEVCTADLFDQPYPENSFSLVWCSHVLHTLGDLPGAARILVRMIKPGGRLVVRENRAGSMSWLPTDVGVGEPGLEGRLECALLRWLVADRQQRGPYPYGWKRLLREAGLVGVTARSFLHEGEPPFDELTRNYLAGYLRRRAALEGVSEADRQVVARLLDPEDPAYVFQRDDLYFHAVSTLYIGRKPG